jgi:valyl-tRNA synthetase
VTGEKKEKKKEKKQEDLKFIETPKGEKKGEEPFSTSGSQCLCDADMSHEMASGYNPIHVESAWYDWWTKEGFFKPRFNLDGSIRKEGMFMIPIPPPNVTGSLHIGHGLTIAIQDTLIRW